MEQLIILLIRLIAGLFENRPASQVPSRRNVPSAPQVASIKTARQQLSNRAVVTSKMPTARRAVRRPLPAKVAIAKPILTNLKPLPAQVPTPPPATIRTVSAKAIVAPGTIPPQSAAAIRKWLTPATLKQQFLLTEILQLPLALRDHTSTQPNHSPFALSDESNL